MPKNTIPLEKFKQLAEKNLSKQRIQELTHLTTVMGASSTLDLATLSDNEIQLLINDKNNEVVARLKRIMQRALQLLRLATSATLSIFLIIPLVLIIVVPTLVLSLTFAVVCFPIFVLSTPFIWFFAAKNKNSTEQKISDTLEKETTLLCILKEVPNNRNDRNEKVISNENPNDNDTNALGSPIENYSLFFNEKNSQLPNSIQNQHASASISMSR